MKKTPSTHNNHRKPHFHPPWAERVDANHPKYGFEELDSRIYAARIMNEDQAWHTHDYYSTSGSFWPPDITRPVEQQARLPDRLKFKSWDSPLKDMRDAKDRFATHSNYFQHGKDFLEESVPLASYITPGKMSQPEVHREAAMAENKPSQQFPWAGHLHVKHDDCYIPTADPTAQYVSAPHGLPDPSRHSAVFELDPRSRHIAQPQPRTGSGAVDLGKLEDCPQLPRLQPLPPPSSPSDQTPRIYQPPFTPQQAVSVIANRAGHSHPSKELPSALLGSPTPEIFTPNDQFSTPKEAFSYVLSSYKQEDRVPRSSEKLRKPKQSLPSLHPSPKPDRTTHIPYQSPIPDEDAYIIVDANKISLPASNPTVGAISRFPLRRQCYDADADGIHNSQRSAVSVAVSPEPLKTSKKPGLNVPTPSEPPKVKGHESRLEAHAEYKKTREVKAGAKKNIMENEAVDMVDMADLARGMLGNPALKTKEGVYLNMALQNLINNPRRREAISNMEREALKAILEKASAESHATPCGMVGKLAPEKEERKSQMEIEKLIETMKSLPRELKEEISKKKKNSEGIKTKEDDMWSEVQGINRIRGSTLKTMEKIEERLAMLQITPRQTTSDSAFTWMEDEKKAKPLLQDKVIEGSRTQTSPQLFSSRVIIKDPMLTPNPFPKLRKRPAITPSSNITNQTTQLSSGHQGLPLPPSKLIVPIYPTVSQRPSPSELPSLRLPSPLLRTPMSRVPTQIASASITSDRSTSQGSDCASDSTDSMITMCEPMPSQNLDGAEYSTASIFMRTGPTTSPNLNATSNLLPPPYNTYLYSPCQSPANSIQSTPKMLVRGASECSMNDGSEAIARISTPQMSDSNVSLTVQPSTSQIIDVDKGELYNVELGSSGRRDGEWEMVVRDEDWEVVGDDGAFMRDKMTW